MDTPSLADTMEAERQRITKVLEDIAQKRLNLDQDERTARIELAGITAYLDAKMGKVLVPSTEVKRAPRGPQGPRGPRKTGIKERVLEVITIDGISKQDILAKLEAGDDKTMQQAISNALVAMKKMNMVVSGDRGMYKLPPAIKADEPTPATPKRVKKDDAAAP